MAGVFIKGRTEDLKVMYNVVHIEMSAEMNGCKNEPERLRTGRV